MTIGEMLSRPGISSAWWSGTLAVLVLSLAPFQPVAGQGRGDCMIRAAYFPGTGRPIELALLVSEQESLPVEFWPGRAGVETKVPVLEVWRFGEWRTDPESGERRFHEHARMKPLASRRQLVLAFLPKRDAKEPARVLGVPLDAPGMKDNSLYAVNLTQGEIRMLVAGERHAVPTGKHLLVNPPTEPGSDYPVQFFFRAGESWRPFVETVWFHGEARRRVCVFVDGVDAGAPKVLSLEDAGEEPVSP